MFFTEFKEACNFELSLNKHLLNMLQSSGIRANLADLHLDEDGIYFTFPNGSTKKIMLYQSKIQEGFFRSNGDPFVHICKCKESEINLNNQDFTAIINYDMKFFIGIYSHRTQIKFYNDKPLSICPQCKITLDKFGSLQKFLVD
ncbi:MULTISPECIES: hypothetical protein [Helicobacter]|uniref:Uncharacterized protein n=1 Tax=Helicobacter ibis TaxID=2962633 RepID=A0ABT4VER7_9HELI|nr:MULTISPECIES: hypothetical protein [Helicobacter]MDA3967059.1 hypothetical protein [Helicobacter sp. WB40]MDA3969193.1 hypothetical protein [Helicobacter ibis]